LLEHPNLNINAPRASDQTTPLYMAADKGHDNIVRMLLARPDLNINQGSMDTDFTALFAAADNGRERVVAMLLEHPSIDVNKPRCMKFQSDTEALPQKASY
jgi:ankyrin repeat protein